MGTTLLAEEKEVSNLFIAQCEDEQEATTVWLVDSRCTNHMSGTKELFENLDESQKINVRLGNDKEIQVQRKGTLLLLQQEKERSSCTMCNISLV